MAAVAGPAARCPFFVAVPVWLVRRCRWPVAVEIDRSRRRTLTALAVGIVAASFTLTPAVGWFVTTYLYQVARVEGGAMSPTISDQDRLIVNKHVYLAGDPAIGDIVMLRYPRDPMKTFVMRVIASGGDEVRIVDGVVFRNGRETGEPYLAYRSGDQWGPEVVRDGPVVEVPGREFGWRRRRCRSIRAPWANPWALTF
jgi:signal peptidase I